jgi:pSer/pThr/pTyr-binding forkhead associated (FHA) protein/ribosome-associated protein YbcJ (S4-like RNA binding protein)
MPNLVIKFDGVVIDQLVLKQGDMSIGRRPGSDILLDNLAVSGNHATIFTVGNDSFVQDLNSTNGTLVNDKRITKHHLANGDEIVIGKHSLTYVDENAASRQSDNLAKTMIITPQRFAEMTAGKEAASAPPAAEKKETPPAPAAAPPPVAGEGAASRTGSIFVLSGANSGKRIDLIKPVTNLGRAGKMAGVISRNGAGGYTLLPGGDGEPLKLNGKQVQGRGEELKNGDIIEVAGSRMQFYLK